MNKFKIWQKAVLASFVPAYFLICLLFEIFGPSTIYEVFLPLRIIAYLSWAAFPFTLTYCVFSFLNNRRLNILQIVLLIHALVWFVLGVWLAVSPNRNISMYTLYVCPPIWIFLWMVYGIYSMVMRHKRSS